MTYRQRANMILGLSFVCFIAIFLWWYTHDVSVWEELLFFVIQSALIGSIADWFAVTALFEKPLGFPYHTELLYRHRDQIIDSMTKIISEKLLQPNMWQDKLYQISFIDKLVGWLRGPNGRRKYLKQQPLVSFFQDRLISLLEDPNSNMFNDAIGLVRELVNSDDFDSLLEKLILQWREESQHSSMSSLTLTKVLGIVDTRKIAKDIKMGIVEWLDQWEHAEGEQREWLCRKLELFLYSMNGQLAFGVQNWQDQFVDSLPIEQWLTATQNSAKDYFTKGDQDNLGSIDYNYKSLLLGTSYWQEQAQYGVINNGKEELKDLLEEQFIHYLEYCRSYPEIKDWLDEQIRRACNVILEHEHSLIAVAVRDVLSGFDKKRFNQFLESKVGEDLAWIRINGAIVGASIGICVFGFLKLYQFTIVPLLRGIVL